MHFELTEEQRMIRETVREFAEKELMPGALERDINETQALDQWKQFCELGFAGMTIEEEYGGTPLDAISEAIVIEELSRCDAGFSVLVAVHSGLTGATMTTWGTEQKQNVVPKMASGEWMAAYSLSEAGAGSDAASLSCAGSLDGDEWVLNGTKLWVTNGSIADVYIIFARSHPDAARKSEPGQRLYRATQHAGTHSRQAGGQAGHPRQRYRGDRARGRARAEGHGSRRRGQRLQSGLQRA